MFRDYLLTRKKFLQLKKKILSKQLKVNTKWKGETLPKNIWMEKNINNKIKIDCSLTSPIFIDFINNRQ